MAFIRISVAASAAIVLASQASSFAPNAPNNNIRSTSSSKLFSIIKGEAFDSTPFDINNGGVGLAKRSAIKISGVSKKGKESEAQELVRYEGLKELDMSAAQSVMDNAGCQLLCSGTGKELYQDPGSSNQVDDRVIQLAPVEAARAAMASAVTIGEDTKSVVLNFLGNDELIMGEVLEACSMIVDGLDLPAKTKVVFNSMSFTDIPDGVCSVAVVASGGKGGGLEGGELYVLDGKWFTAGDVTTATN